MKTPEQWVREYPELVVSITAAIQDDACADLEAENAQLKAEIFALTASQQICVGAAGVGNFDEVCGWIDGMKERLEAAKARGDAALLDMERALARADKGRGST